MDVLIPDTSTPVAESTARQLEARGHKVSSCQSTADANRPACRMLENEQCPLDSHPVDVVVDPGPGEVGGGGALCGLRHRIPLILSTDYPDHCLKPWATDIVEPEFVAETAEEIQAQPLAGHSFVGEVAVLEELRRADTVTDDVRVEVRRTNGGLVADVWFPAALGRHDADRVSVHMAQVIRAYDAWAKHLDIRVHLIEQ
ncbi:MAG: hypothetical protein ACLP6E_08215 [Acidimicrobiales bacterium]